jgi:hypothetical protein
LPRALSREKILHKPHNIVKFFARHFRGVPSRVAGEVEARNVEARQGFTAQQRLETLLAETENVSREDQLFFTEGARAMSAMPDGENADNEGMKGKKLANLEENIDDILAIIRNGTPEQKKEFERHFFHIAETPEFLKQKGLRGDYFTVRYGVISRHFEKDANHNVSAHQWKQLCKEITRPFAIAKYNEGFRLFINLKINNNWAVVGVDIKNPTRGLEINSISTVFGYKEHGGDKISFIYTSPKTTPEQAALLGRLNSYQYPPAQAGIDSLSSDSPEKSSEISGSSDGADALLLFQLT